MANRIYIVFIGSGNVVQRRLIDAPSRAAAIRWAARSHIDAALASQHDLVAALRDGCEIEQARDPDTIDAFEAEESKHGNV